MNCTTCNEITVTSDYVRVKDKTYPIPEHVKGKGFNSQSIINKTVFINGYQLMRNGTFKKTLRAQYHLFF